MPRPVAKGLALDPGGSPLVTCPFLADRMDPWVEEAPEARVETTLLNHTSRERAIQREGSPVERKDTDHAYSRNH